MCCVKKKMNAFKAMFLTAKTQTECTLNVFNQSRCRCHFFSCYAVRLDGFFVFENESTLVTAMVWRFSLIPSVSLYLSLALWLFLCVFFTVSFQSRYLSLRLQHFT